MSALWKKMTGGGGRDAAPPFTLTGATGEPFSLEAQRGVRRSLLMFYPQDMTSG